MCYLVCVCFWVSECVFSAMDELRVCECVFLGMCECVLLGMGELR